MFQVSLQNQLSKVLSLQKGLSMNFNKPTEGNCTLNFLEINRKMQEEMRAKGFAFL